MAEGTCPFPKHKGRSWAWVVEHDRRYAEWLVGWQGPDNLKEEDYDEIMELLEAEDDDTP